MINNYTGSNDSYKLDQTFSNHLLIYGQVALMIPSVFVTITLGPLTDRFGRKMGLVLPSLGSMMQGIINLLIVKFSLSPYYFIIGFFVNGVTGSYASAIASGTAYIADVSSPRWRTLRIAIVETGLAFGRGVGQWIVGYWLEEIRCDFIPLLCFYTGLYAFISAYAILMPESLTRSEREKIRSKNPISLRSYVEGFKLYCGRLSIRSTWKLYVGTFVSCFFLFNYIGAGLINLYVLKALPFDFSPSKIGNYESIKAISNGIVNAAVTGGMVFLKVSDVWIVIIPLLFQSICSLLIGFARNTWQLYTSES